MKGHEFDKKQIITFHTRNRFYKERNEKDFLTVGLSENPETKISQKSYVAEEIAT